MDNLGEKIRKQREEKKMTIEELSKETFLSVAVLKDIEAGKFDQYEGDETYVKMYLKKISDALDLNREELTQSYVALTEEIKLAQLQEKSEVEKNQKEDIVKKGQSFNFDAPHLARKKSVYEDKSHVKIIRYVIVLVLIALVFGVLWWGISQTKSKVDNPSFDPEQQKISEGKVSDDSDKKDDIKDDIKDQTDSQTPTNENVTFTRKDMLNFEFELPKDTESFTFKIVYGNQSWSSLKVNGKDYKDFSSKIYQKDDTIELTFKVSEFKKLRLRNGYSMGHKYYINGVEIPLIDDDSSESATNLILTLKK